MTTPPPAGSPDGSEARRARRPDSDENYPAYYADQAQEAWDFAPGAAEAQSASPDGSEARRARRPDSDENYPAYDPHQPQGPWDVTSGGPEAQRSRPPSYGQAVAGIAPSRSAVANYEDAMVREHGAVQPSPLADDPDEQLERDLRRAQAHSLDVPPVPPGEAEEAQFRRDLERALMLSRGSAMRPGPYPSEQASASAGPAGRDAPGATAGPVGWDPGPAGRPEAQTDSEDPHASEHAPRGTEEQSLSEARFSNPIVQDLSSLVGPELSDPVGRGRTDPVGPELSNPIGSAATQLSPAESQSRATDRTQQAQRARRAEGVLQRTDRTKARGGSRGRAR
ncbi:hypothetical protein [Streptomyces hokutonensis]|uniref:hypothetical protein n=1 Tax=Streptomyces hokutonensis TaxID=1306990 RepID=UPI00381124BE